MQWLLAQVAIPTEVKPALSTLESTVLGAGLILAVVVAFAAVIMLVRVQNARVADQKALSDKSEALMNKMITAFTDMRGALESLKSTLENLKDAEQETQKALSSQQRAFELNLLLQGRAPQPAPTTPPAPVPPDPPPKKARG